MAASSTPTRSPIKTTQWRKYQVREFTEYNMSALFPDDARGYSELSKLARTHLTTMIYDYQFLAYQLTFTDISIEQVEETTRLMNTFLEMIETLTVRKIDMNKTSKDYERMANNFRRWYANPDNEFNQYKMKYLVRYTTYKFQYEVVRTQHLEKTFVAIKNRKFQQWTEIRRIYLPIFGKMFNRIRHTFASMVNETFQYKSITIKNYNAMVAALKPHIDMINTQIAILLDFSPKEKNNLYEFSAYLTPDILNALKSETDRFFFDNGIISNTQEDLEYSLDRWISTLNYFSEQSGKIKQDDGSLIDKINSYNEARNEHIFSVKSIRERLMNTISIMGLNASKIYNPYYSAPAFSFLMVELTGYYYVLDTYKPRGGDIDEYGILSKKLRNRLTVIEEQIDAVMGHEEMMTTLITNLQEQNEFTSSVLSSEYDTSSSFSTESSPVTDAPSDTPHSTPLPRLSFMERLQREETTLEPAIEDKPKSISPPTLFERQRIALLEERGSELPELDEGLPYPTYGYGEDFFFDEYLS